MFVENIVKSTKDNGIQKVFVLILKKKNGKEDFNTMKKK